MPVHADLVLAGGKILTLDPQARIVHALAVRNGRIAALGRDDEIAAWTGPDTQRVDLRGRLAVPGLIDGHAHMDREGLYNGYGTTSVFEGHGIAAEVIAAYQTLRQRGRPSVRAHLLLSPSWPSADAEAVRSLLRSWGAWLGRRGLGDEYLRVGGLYAESDYSDENRLRAATSPYTSWAGFFYEAALPEAVMVEMMIEAARNDVRVGSFTPNILDLYERVDRVVPITGRRWVVEHIGIYGPDEVKRIRDLGLVLTAHTSKYVWKEGAELAQRLGPGQAGRIAPLRSLLDAGVHVSLATDNVPPSLFHPIHHAVARRPRGAREPIGPEQALTREEALACASRAGAYLTFEEDDKGSLEVGKLADVAVLDQDVLAAPEDAIPDTRAAFVLVGGRLHPDPDTGGTTAWL